jgi:hypothetical protein
VTARTRGAVPLRDVLCSDRGELRVNLTSVTQVGHPLRQRKTQAPMPAPGRSPDRRGARAPPPEMACGSAVAALFCVSQPAGAEHRVVGQFQ